MMSGRRSGRARTALTEPDRFLGSSGVMVPMDVRADGGAQSLDLVFR